MQLKRQLKRQLTSLELSKVLKDLGVKQESLFYWHNPFNDDYWEPTASKRAYIEKKNVNPENYSAFTVSELGEMLRWENLYIFGTPKELLHHIDGKNTEADARAKMLIYLLEKKMVTLEFINKGDI
jgi:hypothetical protein